MKNLDDIRAARKIPFWVALRWLIVVIFRGPEIADKYIRPQDRPS